MTSSCRSIVLAALFASTGCRLPVNVPRDAQILCDESTDCPPDFICVRDRCVDTFSSCVVGDAAVADGAPCFDVDNAVCIGGQCTTSACGDGVVSSAALEECDDGARNDDAIPDRCRTSCKRPRCGDGVVDAFEACDGSAGDALACAACVRVCPAGFGDCDGAVGGRDELGVVVRDCECAAAPVATTSRSIERAAVASNGVLYWVTRDTANTTDRIALYRRTPSQAAELLFSDVSDGAATSLVVDDAHAFFADGVLVRRVAHDAIDVELLFAFPAAELAMGGDALVVTDRAAGAIGRVAKDATTRPALLVDQEVLASAAIARGAFTAFATSDGEIVEVDGLGARFVRARGHTGVAELATDGTRLYFFDDTRALTALDPTLGLEEALLQPQVQVRLGEVHALVVEGGLAVFAGCLEAGVELTERACGVLAAPLRSGPPRMLQATARPVPQLAGATAGTLSFLVDIDDPAAGGRKNVLRTAPLSF